MNMKERISQMSDEELLRLRDDLEVLINERVGILAKKYAKINLSLVDNEIKKRERVNANIFA